MSVLVVLAIIAGLIGLVGSVVPGIPGPPISWVGILLMYFNQGTDQQGEPMSITLLFVMLAVTIIVTVLDYVVPAYFTKISGGTKAASWGAIIGLFVGMVVPPVGMIVGSLLGAFLADFIIEDRGVWNSFKSSIGAFAGFMCGTGIKLISSAVMLYYIIVFI